MATNERWNGTAMVPITVLQRWNGTAFVAVTVMQRWNGTAFVDCLASGGGGGISATANKALCEGFVFEPEPAPNFAVVTSDSVTVTPTNGTAPYTHSWVLVSGASAVQPTLPTGATTAFEANVGKNQEKIAVYRDTITDALAATTTVDVTVSLSYTTDI